MTNTHRAARWLAAAAAGAAVTLLPSAALAAPAPHAAFAPACETPGLVVWLDTNGNGAAGSVFYNLEFTNLSGVSCTLNGFPFIHAVDINGHNLGHRAAFTSAVPHQITLKAGQTGKAVLQIVDAGNFPSSSCDLVTAAGLKVFPPNQTTAKTVPFPFAACSKSGPVYLRVAPVTK